MLLLTEQYSITILLSILQKQPCAGVPMKGVQKICSKFTEEHPC